MPAVKKKRKMYFGQVTEDAIIKYNKETDPIIRNQIYNESITMDKIYNRMRPRLCES